MRDLDKELVVKEISKMTTQEVVELELTYDYIVELFKDYKVVEFADLFYDEDCPLHHCDKDMDCRECLIFQRYQGSKEQLSVNNWVDLWGVGYWGASQHTSDMAAKGRLEAIAEDDDLEYRLWTFDRGDERLIYYYNRDRFADNWFVFKRRKKMDWLIESVLDKIENEMRRLYWNKNQKNLESPFQNTGAVYSNDTFTVRAYNWSDDGNELPNFEYKDLKVWWYKHSHRGLSWEYNHEKNTLPPSYFLEDMIGDCITSLQDDWKIK